MNAARKSEIEERLQTSVAPPPPELLDALRREIPAHLHLVTATAPPPRRTEWPLRLAAGLVVAALAGWMAYSTGLGRGPAPLSAPALQQAPPAAAPAAPPLANTQPAAPAAAVPLLGAAPTPAPRAPQKGEIRVRVADEQGVALPGVEVVLQSKTKAAENQRRRATTDWQGTAAFVVTGDKDYALEAKLEGFNSVQAPAVEGRAGRRTTVEMTLSAGVEDVITVTAESPLLDEKRISSGTAVAAGELSKVPTARAPYINFDAFEELRPGRANVGGNENGQAAASGRDAQAGPSTGGSAEPNDQPYGDMFFHSAGTNPFVDADEDPLSTFGLDVDTGSYTVARRYLRDGHLPPPEAIRVEEFVNAFHYGDSASPTADFALSAEGAPTPFADPRHYRLVRFAVAARTVEPTSRKPAVLTFVVDVSGSMAVENRLGLVKRALGLLLAQLREDDRVGLVVFGSEARVLLEPTADHAAIAAAVERLESEGSTNAEAGLALGFDVARRAFRAGSINRLLLCSDGVANVGATGPETILARIGDEAARGIQLSTIGFGMGNYNDVLMERLADEGDGTYAYVDDLEEARRIFVENLTGTLQTVAEEARAQVEWNPRVVRSYRLLGYENRDIADTRFRDDTVDAGEIGAGHTVTALYEVKLAHTPWRGERLATLHVRYRPAGAKEFREVAEPLLGRDVERSPDRASAALRLSQTVAQFAELLKRTYWTKDETFEQLAAAARELSAVRGREAELTELRELIELAAAAARAKAQGEQR